MREHGHLLTGIGLTRHSIENMPRVTDGNEKNVSIHVGRNVTSEVDSRGVPDGVEKVSSGPVERECHGEEL